MKPPVIHYSARQLLLSLVTEAAEPLASQTLVKMGELFGISANNVRVSLNRLVNDGLLQLSDTGVYVLKGSARSLAAAQERWRHLESEILPWHGGWHSLTAGHHWSGLRYLLRVLPGQGKIVRESLQNPFDAAQSLQKITDIPGCRVHM